MCVSVNKENVSVMVNTTAFKEKKKDVKKLNDNVQKQKRYKEKKGNVKKGNVIVKDKEYECKGGKKYCQKLSIHVKGHRNVKKKVEFHESSCNLF